MPWNSGGKEERSERITNNNVRDFRVGERKRTGKGLREREREGGREGWGGGERVRGSQK